MKHAPLFLALSLATLLAGCGKKADAPAPAVTGVPTGAAVAYTDASGQPVAVKSVGLLLLTAAPRAANQPRRSLSFQVELANGGRFTAQFRYPGSTPPPQLGAVPLDEVAVSYSATSQPANEFVAALSAGSVTVDEVSPTTISGAYNGPVSPNGAPVRFTFTRMKL